MGSRRQDRGALMSQLDFSTTLGNAWFPAPIFTASGCASSGKELAQFFDLRDMGAIVTKSIMTKPRAGRATRADFPGPAAPDRDADPARPGGTLCAASVARPAPLRGFRKFRRGERDLRHRRGHRRKNRRAPAVEATGPHDVEEDLRQGSGAAGPAPRRPGEK